MNLIREYTNYDGIHIPTNCGQAAATTYLVNTEKLEATDDAMKVIEKIHPPDIFFGFCGSSKSNIKQICKSYGVSLKEKIGHIQLKADLVDEKMGIILIGWLDKSTFPYIFGHWVVAYNYDVSNDTISLSNYGDIKTQELLDMWDTAIPTLGGMNHTYLTE